MNKKTQRLAAAFFAVACLIAPLSVSAMSIKEYNTKTSDQRAQFVTDTIEKRISDAAKTNPALAKAIDDYFNITPPGKSGPMGIIAFMAEYDQVEEGAKKGQFDLSVVQIEDMVDAVIQTDVMPTVTKKNTAPAPKPTANP